MLVNLIYFFFQQTNKRTYPKVQVLNSIMDGYTTPPLQLYTYEYKSGDLPPDQKKLYTEMKIKMSILKYSNNNNNNNDNNDNN